MSQVSAVQEVGDVPGLRQVEIDGARLAYVERGTGDAVVLVHGGISDLTVWEPLLGRLAGGHRVISYSRRFAWPNDPIPDGADDQMLPHAEDLLAVVEKLAPAGAHLVGNSWGAFVCLLAASRRPDLVRSLVLQEPPVLPLFLGTPPKPAEVVGTVITRPRTGLALMGMMFGGMLPTISAAKKGELLRSVELFARRVALGDAGYEALPAEVRQHMVLNAATHAAQMLGRGFPPFGPEDARAIRTRALLMGGELSPRWLRCLADRLAELLPNVARVEIPGASHLMHQANPADTAAAILDFWSRPE